VIITFINIVISAEKSVKRENLLRWAAIDMSLICIAMGAFMLLTYT